MLKDIHNNPYSSWFAKPVDANEVPAYYTMIKNPSDLSTVGKRLRTGTYNSNINAMVKDLRQIFINCYSFNQDASVISIQCRLLEKTFESKILPKAMAALGVFPEAANCAKLLRRLETHKQAFWFKTPVSSKERRTLINEDSASNFYIKRSTLLLKVFHITLTSLSAQWTCRP